MKNQYLILRMTTTDLYDNQFTLRGFNPKRMEQVIGVIVVVADSLTSALADDIFHLQRVCVSLMPSDTHQNWVKLTWSGVHRKTLSSGLLRLPSDVADAIRTMRNNRMYHTVDTTIPEVFRDCYTTFDMPTTRELRQYSVEQATPAPHAKALSDYTVEELLQHLKERTGAEITIKL